MTRPGISQFAVFENSWVEVKALSSLRGGRRFMDRGGAGGGVVTVEKAVAWSFVEGCCS